MNVGRSLVHYFLTWHVTRDTPVCDVTIRVYLLPSLKLKMGRGRGTFGLSSARGGTRGRSSFRGFRGRASWRGSKRGGDAKTSVPQRGDEGTLLAERFEKVKLNDEIDEKLGFPRIQEGNRREGWLVNMHPVKLIFGIPSSLVTEIGRIDSAQGPGMALWEVSG